MFLNIEKGKKKCPFLNAPLSFYRVLSKVIQSSELISSYCNVFFLLFLCFRINTRWLNTTEQWTSSVKRSGEMQGLSSFLLKAGFEGEIVQRSKIYTLDRQSPSDVSSFVDSLDTKEWWDFIKDWFLMFSSEIPNKRAPRFKTCLDDSGWFAGPSFLKIR